MVSTFTPIRPSRRHGTFKVYMRNCRYCGKIYRTHCKHSHKKCFECGNKQAVVVTSGYEVTTAESTK